MEIDCYTTYIIHVLTVHRIILYVYSRKEYYYFLPFGEELYSLVFTYRILIGRSAL